MSVTYGLFCGHESSSEKCAGTDLQFWVCSMVFYNMPKSAAQLIVVFLRDIDNRE